MTQTQCFLRGDSYVSPISNEMFHMLITSFYRSVINTLLRFIQILICKYSHCKNKKYGHCICSLVIRVYKILLSSFSVSPSLVWMTITSVTVQKQCTFTNVSLCCKCLVHKVIKIQYHIST